MGVVVTDHSGCGSGVVLTPHVPLDRYDPVIITQNNIKLIDSLRVTR